MKIRSFNSDSVTNFKKYLSVKPSDASSDKNANAASRSFQNFIMHVANDPLEDLTIQLVYEKSKELFSDDEKRRCYFSDFWLREFHINKESPLYYFHDITRGVIPYCYAASVGHIFDMGRSYAEEYASEPPHRLDSFVGQITEFVMEMSQQHAGAIALPDLFIYCSKLFSDIEQINKCEKYISNCFQSFIFIMHNKFRVQGQSPFTNVTIMDRPTMFVVFNIINKDDQDKVIAIQRIFVKEIEKGCRGMPFRFPVVTFNLKIDKNGLFEDGEIRLDAIKMAKKGLANIYVSKDTRKFASCCRMVNDVTKMYGVDSFGNGGVNIGSTRVITLVLPEIIRLGGFDLLEKSMDIAGATLVAHREVLSDCIDAGFLKFFTHGIESLKRNFFSTFGFVGLVEACAILSGKDPSDKKSILVEDIIEWSPKILKCMKNKSDMMSEEFSVPFNVEQIPGESAAVDLGETLGMGCLSNQYIPLDVECDILDRIRIAGMLDSDCSGGAITHLNFARELSDAEAGSILDLAAIHGMTHFAINICMTICESCRTRFYGKKTQCSSCGETNRDNLSFVTRIIGYFVPTKNWRQERKDEFSKRKWYEEAA
jgi:ribonucleoside-triphosphate reductase